MFTGAYATQPGDRRAGAGLHRRLRADGLRHRRDHGGARRRTSGTGEFAETYGLPIVRTVQPPEGWTGEAFTGDGPAINSATTRCRWTAWASPRPSAASSSGCSARASARAPRPTGCATGCSAASGTGASRSRSFRRGRRAASRCPSRCCPCELPEVDDYPPQTLRPGRRRQRAGAAAVAGRRLGRPSSWTWATARARTAARRTPCRKWAGSCWYELRYLDPQNEQAFVDPANEAYWMGPRTGERPGRRRPVRRRRRARGAAPAVRALLAQGAVRPGPRASAEPFRRLFNQGYIQAYAFTRRPRSYVAAAEVVEERDGAVLRGRAGHPRVREDGQVAEERGDARRDVRRLRRRHLPACTRCRWARWTCRGRGRRGPSSASLPLPAAPVAQRRRRVDRRGRGSPTSRPTRRPGGCCTGRSTASARHTRRCGSTPPIAKLIELNNARHQAGRRRPARLAEPLVLMTAPLAPHLAEELWPRLGHDGSLAYVPFPVGRPGALLVRGHRHVRGAGAGQGARPAGGPARRSVRTSCASWRWRARRSRRRWPGGRSARWSSAHPSSSTSSRSERPHRAGRGRHRLDGVPARAGGAGRRRARRAAAGGRRRPVVRRGRRTSTRARWPRRCARTRR